MKITAIPTLVFYKATENFLADTTKASTIRKSLVSPTLIGTDDARLTSILAASTGKSDKKMDTIPKPQVLVKGTSNVIPRILTISIGWFAFGRMWYTAILEENQGIGIRN